MSFGNQIVGALLRSPLHGLLSGSTDLVRYTGRRSGRTITTPTQYAERGDGLVILVARPATKSWWRNFGEERPVEVLVRRTWRPMQGLAVIGADDPAAAAPLLETYLQRFPKTARALPGASFDEQVRNAVLVRCRPA